MAILYLTGDLMFSSRIGSIARAASVDLKVAADASALKDATRDSVQLVILDLTMANLDVAATVADVRRNVPNAKVIAYGPHVHETALAAARDAGCDEVLSKGQFNASLQDIVDGCRQ